MSLFTSLAHEGEVVRYIVAGTEINAQVVVEDLQYREKDSSGDVYYTLSLAEWVDLEAVTVSGPPPPGTQPTAPETAARR